MSRLAWDRRDFCGVLGLGPPRLRWAAAGPARRPCLRLGLRSQPGPLAPCGAAGPGSGPSAPLGSLRGRCGLSAGRLRPSARPRGSPGGPRCGVAGSGPRRPWLAGGSAPSSGGLGRGGSCRLPPPVGAAALLSPPGLRPLPRRAGPSSPGPCRAARQRRGPPRLLRWGARGGGPPGRR